MLGHLGLEGELDKVRLLALGLDGREVRSVADDRKPKYCMVRIKKTLHPNYGWGTYLAVLALLPVSEAIIERRVNDLAQSDLQSPGA
jgi:hypothetical protein